jgi:hypothetical protein
MIKQFFAISLATLSLSTLTGCASIVNGTNQPVSVSTGSVKGATCALQNNKGRWYISSTPSSIVVNRSFDNLQIRCEKPGYKHGYKNVVSKTKAMAFGNVIFGGVVGAGIDMADGAAYDYPSDIYVPMYRA